MLTLFTPTVSCLYCKVPGGPNWSFNHRRASPTGGQPMVHSLFQPIREHQKDDWQLLWRAPCFRRSWIAWLWWGSAFLWMPLGVLGWAGTWQNKNIGSSQHFPRHSRQGSSAPSSATELLLQARRHHAVGMFNWPTIIPTTNASSTSPSPTTTPTPSSTFSTTKKALWLSKQSACSTTFHRCTRRCVGEQGLLG